MTKKEFVKKLNEGAKTATSLAVGVGATVVTEMIFNRYAPAESESAFRKMTYSIGTKGASIVIGATAADMTREEWEAAEEFIKERISNAEEKSRQDEVA